VRLFICLVVLSTLTFVPAAVLASPMIAPIGRGVTATLTFSPDPPQVGIAHATLAFDGASSAQLASTQVTFSTAMPSMSMSGAGGSARWLGAGRFGFDVPIGMATTWSLTIRATGGVNGTSTYRFVVAGDASAAASGALSGMTSSAGGSGPWRTAAFVLAVLLVIAVVLSARRERRTGVLLVLGAAAAVVVVVAVLQTHAASDPGSTSGMDMAAMSDVKGEAPSPVTIAVVRRVGSSADGPVVSAPGTLAPYLVQDIVARTSGVLRDFSLYAGDRVAAGETIARLDEPELAARAGASAADARAQAAAAAAASIESTHHAPNAVRIAQADAEVAARDAAAARAELAAKSEQGRYWNAELRRERTLLSAGAVSQQEYEDERAQAAGAAAALTSAREHVASANRQADAERIKVSDAAAAVEMAGAQAENQRQQAARAAGSAQVDAIVAGYTAIVAPSDGVVLKRLVDPGTYVPAGTAVARVAVIDRLRVQASVAQQDLPKISVSAPVEARVDGRGVLRGRVTSVSPVVDAATRTANVEAVVENPGRAFVPGGYVQVALRASAAAPRDALVVPSSAIVETGGAAVWSLADGVAHRVPVIVIADDGTTALVRAPALRDGSRVAIVGAASLEEGQRVTERSSGQAP
jgi:RND family efflux transporter MFP subunit